MSLHFREDRTTVRLIKACVITLAIVCAVPGVEAISKVFAGSDTAVISSSGLFAERLGLGGDPFAALDRVEGFLEVDKRNLPDRYLSEIGLLSDAESVRVDESGEVVGYCVLGDESEVFERLSQSLEEKGWTSVPLGGVTGATFTKREGEYTWMLATCTQVGESTSVVTRCLSA